MKLSAAIFWRLWLWLSDRHHCSLIYQMLIQVYTTQIINQLSSVLSVSSKNVDKLSSSTENMCRWFITVKCDPEDSVTSAVEERLKLKSEEHGHDVCCIWNNISKEAGISSESYGWTEHSTPSVHRLSVCFWFLVRVQAWLLTIFLESGGGTSVLDFPKNCLFCHCIV